jgi:hypothetical protein
MNGINKLTENVINNLLKENPDQILKKGEYRLWYSNSDAIAFM